MKFSRLFTICAIFCSMSAFVQAESENKLEANLVTEAGYIDNFLFQDSNEQSTAYYMLSSNLALTSKTQHSAFDFEAQLTSHFFDKFENDDHSDFSLIPKYQFKFTQNQLISLSAFWLNSYTYRGTGLSIGEAENLSQGDEAEDVGAAIGYEYGTVESQGKLNFELSYHENNFTTRRDHTRALDTEILSFNTNFDYLLSGKTFLAFDLDYKVTQYPNNPINNRDTITGLIGLKWYTTVISELNFLVGYQQLKFQDSHLSDEGTFKWRLDYTWRPSAFTQIHIVSNRKFDESYRLISSYRLAQTQQLDLEHAFTEYLNIFATVGLNNEQFITIQNTREEDYIFATLALDYQYSDRLSVQLNYHYKSLQANTEEIDYLYNRFGLSIKVAL